ncbi:DegV family protein [uncultured Oscillibacter sp.]|uniref:DegV family protein n=1 Tax=uncultured Oscillibacter sp. TaxID=876091 RepID=UPI0025F68846|nr:DegV family protein [uncultured Oscillibacter sp.]
MIKITTDSTCDLPEALLREFDITVLPLGIVKGEGLFRDGVDIHPADIAAHVDAGGAITTTNAVNTADYLDCFSRLLKTCDAVIHVNLGSKISSCHQNARIAAAELSNVYVADSDNITVGMGELVLRAARAARAGHTPEEILAELEDLRRRMEVSFVLDRLDYMKRGGRCSAVTAIGANLLKLHPCIEVVDGKLAVTKKYRGSMERVVSDYLHDRLDGRDDIDTERIWLVDSAFGPELADAARAVLQADGRFGEILESKAGCTIFSHCGPNTVGLAILRRQ